MTSKAFYIFSNVLFYADCFKHVTPAPTTQSQTTSAPHRIFHYLFSTPPEPVSQLILLQPRSPPPSTALTPATPPPPPPPPPHPQGFLITCLAHPLSQSLSSSSSSPDPPPLHYPNPNSPPPPLPYPQGFLITCLAHPLSQSLSLSSSSPDPVKTIKLQCPLCGEPLDSVPGGVGWMSDAVILSKLLLVT